MANLIFQKKKLKEGQDIYAIKQVGGPHVETVVPGDEITFKRSGQDNNWGFEITFDGANAPDTITVPNGSEQSEVDWAVPDKVGWWKYNVAFPHDNTQGDVVEPLDPIIIINPSLSSSSSYLRDAAVFVVGVIAGVAAVQLFF